MDINIEVNLPDVTEAVERLQVRCGFTEVYVSRLGVGPRFHLDRGQGYPVHDSICDTFDAAVVLAHDYVVREERERVARAVLQRELGKLEVDA